jgi:hypothetical protein
MRKTLGVIVWITLVCLSVGTASAKQTVLKTQYVTSVKQWFQDSETGTCQRVTTSDHGSTATNATCPAKITVSYRAKSVEINDQVLAGGKAVVHLSSRPYYAVEQVDGEYIVVVKYWNEYQQKMLTGSIVTLDANNQSQPDGMRWRFTLTPDGYLMWEEVKK